MAYPLNWEPDQIDVLNFSPTSNHNNPGHHHHQQRVQQPLPPPLVIPHPDKTEVNLRDFECPICLQVMRPPTTLCSNGHTVCADCRPSLTKCPICSDHFTSVRNITFDNLLSTLMVPCKAESRGCPVKLPNDLQEIHNSHCVYLTTVECLLGNCQKDILRADYNRHIRRDHVADILYEDHPPITVKLNDFWDESNILLLKDKSLDQFFEIHVEQKETSMQVATRHVGSVEKAVFYDVVYTVERGGAQFSVCNNLFNATIARDAMFIQPHLDIDEKFESCNVFVVIRKSAFAEQTRRYPNLQPVPPMFMRHFSRTFGLPYV